MARFRYRMQNILNIKESMEQQARMQYAAALQKLREEEERLVYLRHRKEGYERHAKELLSETLDIREITENNRGILITEEEIKAQQIRIRNAQAAADKARQKMTEVMQERKTHEKLKERAFEQFLSDEKHKESKEIDELTSYTYGQRIAESENT